MTTHDGTDTITGKIVTGDKLDKTLIWHGTSNPTAGTNAIPQYGLFLNTSSGIIYENTGTLSTPIWSSRLSSSVTLDQVYPLSTVIGDYSIPTDVISSSPSFGASVEYLVVGGGGSGGADNAGANGGGGGAGGYRTGTGFTVSAQAYTITVGGGGASSTFSTITSAAGGAGATGGSGNAGGSGGSGGGGSSGNAGAGGAGDTPDTTPDQGFAGGAGRAGFAQAGGGGGSSAVGLDGINGGTGGAGTSNSISGGTVTYAAGGTQGAGGAGTANTGNGGGGSSAGNAGAGGSGIVIIRYTTNTIGATGGTITYSGGYTIHTFLTSGTFTVLGSSAYLSTDDSTTTSWTSNSENNPNIYFNLGSAKELAAIAINLNRSLTTETEIQIRFSTDVTFTSGETVRTLLVTDFTDDTWRFITIPRSLLDKQYFQIYGSNNSKVLSINEVKYISPSAALFDRSHFHKYLSPTSTSDNGLDSN